MKIEILSDVGSGECIVYVPGIDGSGELLLGTAARLEAEFRLIRLCYRASDKAAAPSYESMATEIAALLDTLVSEPYILLAESFGGGVALQMALDSPAMVKGVALVNSFPHFRARFRLAIGRLLAPCIPIWLFKLGRKLAGTRELFGRMREADAVARFHELNLNFFDKAYCQRLRMIAGLDLRPRLGEVAQPVAVFAGTKDKVVDSEFQALYMSELLPDVELEIVKFGGHLILPLQELPWPQWLGKLAERAIIFASAKQNPDQSTSA